MGVYLVTCTSSMLFAWFWDKFRRKDNKLQFTLSIILSALPCIIIAGFRYGIGSDYFSYEYNFLIESSTKDPLYYSVFNPVVQFFGGDFSTSVFIVSAIVFLLTYARIFDDSPYPWLSVFLLFGMTFFFASMNAMRQFLALSILFCAIKSLEQKQNIRFFIFVTIASGIHLSSSIFVALYFLYKIKLDARIVVILTPVIFAGIYLLKNDFVLLAMSLNTYSNFIESDVINGTSVIIQSLWQLVLVVIGGLVYKNNDMDEKNNKYRIYLCAQLIALWEYALASVINPNEIMRIIWVFSYSSIIFTPMVIYRLPSKLIKIVAIFATILGFSIFCYYVIGVNNSHEVLPYNSIFDVD